MQAEDYLGLRGQFINRNVANERRRLVLDEVDGALFLVCHSWSDTRWESRMNIVVQTLTSLYFDTSDGSFATWHQWGTTDGRSILRSVHYSPGLVSSPPIVRQ